MKNIHILPTDKPSKLFFNHNKGFEKYQFSKEPFINGLTNTTNQNIYITSNEEIKEGDYGFYPPFGIGKSIVIDGDLCFHIESKDGKGSFTQRTYQTLDRNRKIILTTDQDLIKDGVQAIDDEFLEWFVKNPSCEEVEVEEFEPIYGHQNNSSSVLYKIIIPKEEPKQKCDGDILTCLNEKCVCKAEKIKRGYIASETKLVGLQITLKDGSQQFITKQETLKEAAEKYSKYNLTKEALEFAKTICYAFKETKQDDLVKEAILTGIQWSQKRSYSEEEVYDLIHKRDNYLMTPNSKSLKEFLTPKEWFNQNKKK